MQFALARGIDVEAHARAFAATERVRIRPFLEEACAAALHRALRGREDWRQVVNSGERLFELDRPTRAAMSAEQRTALETAVGNGAREGFQYRYETLRLADGDGAEGVDPDGPIAGFTRWLSGAASRDLLRAITAAGDIAFADGQATAYSPGDFLTGHDDDVAGKRRRAAYVLGLTPVWRPEWGGLLLFHQRDGGVVGQVPAFNSLDLFAVPQPHSVSQIVPWAPNRRYAITGWLRAARA